MSYSKQIRVIIILTVHFIIFLGESEFTGTSTKVAALTEEQRREIEKLRAELNEAFENEPSPAEQGVVVQPGWTQSDNGHERPTKVVVTAEGLNEADALRKEINQAVSQDIYAGSSADTEAIQRLVEELQMKERGKSALMSIVGNQEEEANLDPHLGAAADDFDDTNNGPNVIEASSAVDDEIDIRKLQRLEISKRREREVLILKSVEEDYSFDLGDDVEQWVHILHDGREFFIARRATNLLIVRKDAAKYEKGNVVEIGQPITYLETYSFWNMEQEQQEGVILVASRDRVLWYRGNNVTNQIELYWEWVVGNTITGLTFFTTESKEYLVVSSNQSSRAGYYTLNIYQFELELKEFWIAQRMQLQYPCEEVTILDTGRDIVLAVPQNNTAAIYFFNPHADDTDHIRFQLRRTFETEGIKLISGFQMGGRSYLALGGMSPQILLYEQGDFVPKTIFGHNFGLVELFLPVPVRTYRDDLILLVQHHVDFETHGLTVLETLIWDGEAFEASIPVPCHLGDHIVYGVSCMLDIQRDEGLRGAALFKRGEEVSIIVPRNNAESGLFQLHTELLAKNSELLDLKDIFSFLQDWVKEQDDLIAKADAFLSMGEQIGPVKPNLTELELLKTPELTFNGNVGEIYVNDYKWTEEDTTTDLEYVMNALEQLGAELSNGRDKRDVSQYDDLSTSDFDIVEVENLNVDYVNNEKFFIQNGEIDVENGILKLNDLEVLQEVNTRAKRQTKEDMVEIKGDLEFESINGLAWKDILGAMVFRNQPFALDKLDVDGDVIIEDQLWIDVLNSLNFPDDFLWSSGPSASVVKSEKIFTSTLSANAVDTEGVINGMDPLDAITLSDIQEWKGLPTFAQLEVSEKLEVNGSARGRDFGDLPQNPTLDESNIIPANCNFESLQVLGPLHVGGTFDNIPLSSLLEDIVQRPINGSTEIFVPSKKVFKFAEFPIDFNVEDHQVNRILVDEFITLHTNQNLNLSVIEGYLYFANLTLTGLYDSYDIKDILNNSIPINEPHISPTTQLNFVHPIQAGYMNIIKSLNGISIGENYQTIDGNLYIPQAHFGSLHSKTVNIPHDITGTGRLNGLNLHEFTTNDINLGSIFLDELVVPMGLELDELNTLNASYLMSFLDKVNDVPEMILDGTIQVDHVNVKKDVQVGKLNGHHFDEDIQLTVIWLDRPNYLSTSLHFLEPLMIKANLNIEGNYNGKNFVDLLNDFVFRTPNATSLILAPKNFKQEVTVSGNTYIDALNGTPFTYFATKRGSSPPFKGSIQLNGNLIVDDLEVRGHLNDHDMSYLNRAVRHDENLNTFVLPGAVEFPSPMQMQDLTIYGNLNKMPRLNEYFSNLINKNDIAMLKGNKTFTGRVSISKGAYVKSLNGFNVLAILDNIIFTQESLPIEVKSPVSFQAPIHANEVVVRTELHTSNLNGCSIEGWLRDTLRVDQHQDVTKKLHFARGSIDGNSIFASFLNDVDLSKVITLHTSQMLSSDLLFSELYLDGEILAKGSVNNVDLKKEYLNTLLTSGNQHITTPLTLESAKVLENLQVNAPVNSNKNLRLLATLQDNLEFESPLFFQDISTRNVQTKDLVSGINFDQLFRYTVWLNGAPQQWITGNWSVRSLTVKTGPSLPSYVMNPTPQMSFNAVMRTTRDDRHYKDMCRKLGSLVEAAQKRVYFVKHVEEGFEFPLDNGNGSKRVFFSIKGNETFLLINENCTSEISKWNADNKTFNVLTTFETGAIQEVVWLSPPVNSTFLQFATNTYYVDAEAETETEHCHPTGLNLWELDDHGIIGHKRKFHEPVSNTQKAPGLPSFLLAVAKDFLYKISFENEQDDILWPLPHTKSNESYSLIPSDLASPILTNGDEVFLLNIDAHKSEIERLNRYPHVKFSLPLYYRRSVKNSASQSKQILKANTTTVNKFTFANFQRIVERSLNDLIYQLHLEVNITQLSIPESDLYDENLVQDFIAIMEELQKQKIYPEETFADVKIEELQIPDDPAKVLAARTVQIIWPVIVEMEEINDYVRPNETVEDPMCARITGELGRTIHDVLVLANAKYTDYTNHFSSVIERIRKFQNDLGNILKDLKEPELKENGEATSTRTEKFAEKITDTGMDQHLRDPIEGGANGTWLKFPSDSLIAFNPEEMLEFQVGTAMEPHKMLAVSSSTLPKDHLYSTQHDLIKLYINVPQIQLFQTMPTEQGRFLTSIRLHDATLLAYVENCCTVQVKIYRGIEGFVDLATFHTPTEIQRLFNVSLMDVGHVRRHYLATVLRDKIVFYEIVVKGLTDLSDVSLMCK